MSVWWGNVYGDCTLTWLCKDRACRRRLALCRTHAGGVAEGLNGMCNCGRTSNQTASSSQSVVLMLQNLTMKQIFTKFVYCWVNKVQGEVNFNFLLVNQGCYICMASIWCKLKSSLLYFATKWLGNHIYFLKNQL